MIVITDWWEPVAALLIAGIGAGFTLWYSRHAGLVDMPNQRSSHTVPTPKGGGVALVAAVLAVMALVVSESAPAGAPVYALISAAALALAVVGWLDDRSHVAVPQRFLVHLLAGVALGVFVNLIHPLPGVLNLLWIGWWIFWTIASINIVNFMDGIDGMMATQGLIYGVFLFALLSPNSVGARYGLILGAACLGFLLWNWAPAKIFMGDVGSGPLGFLFVVGGAMALQIEPAALVFLPLFPLYLDALITLLSRARKRERLTDAHRQHLYQRIANGGAGHAKVSLAYAVAAAIGAVVAVGIRGYSPLGMTVGILAYIGVISSTWVWTDASVRLRDRSAARV